MNGCLPTTRALTGDAASSADARSNQELDAQILEMDARHGERVIEAVHGFLGRFVSYPSEHARVAHALWIAHTHLMDKWDSTPRLAFLSAEPASGKTRALEITELLVPNPVATVNVSPAYLFRKVGAEEGATILYDEIDTVFGPRAKDNEDIRGLLNAGHRRGATTGRCVLRGNEVVLEELPAYSAVALAGIGWLPDTLLSRSVIIRMRRRHAGERVEAFRRRLHEIEGWRVRDLLAGWAKSIAANIKWPILPEGIVDRNADIWEPLIAVADAIGGSWPRRAREAGVSLVSEAREVEPSLGVRLLADLRLVFQTQHAMSSKFIIQALILLEEAPWSDLKGRPLDERGLATRLRQYGVKSKTIRDSGDKTSKGYARADLLDLWTRYLPPLVATSVTSDTSVTTAGESARDGAVGDRETSPTSKINHVSDVSAVTALASNGSLGRICAHCHRGGGTFCDISVGGTPLSLHLACKEEYRP